MQNEVPPIEYLSMAIDAYPNDEFLVAKLERISSAPVRIIQNRDNRSTALERLVDIFRCGKDSRNYQDFVDLKKDRKTFGPLAVDRHWASYVEAIVQAKTLDRLDFFQLRQPLRRERSTHPDLAVKYAIGRMNELPYVIAAVGDIFASPAAILLMNAATRESALARLYDVFRVGPAGCAYRELLQIRRSSGQTAGDVQIEWDACQSAVLWEIKYTRLAAIAPHDIKSKWQACDEGIERELERAMRLARDMEIAPEAKRKVE